MGHPSIYSVIYFLNDPGVPTECPMLLDPGNAVHSMHDSQLAGEAVSEQTSRVLSFGWEFRVQHEAGGDIHVFITD